jgi:hypothetical protein
MNQRDFWNKVFITARKQWRTKWSVTQTPEKQNDDDNNKKSFF